MTNLVTIQDRRHGDRRQRQIPVLVDRRRSSRDRRLITDTDIPQHLTERSASIVMLALLEGLADNVLGGDQWTQSIQHAYDVAVTRYHIDPEIVADVINRIMEVKENRLKDVREA